MRVFLFILNVTLFSTKTKHYLHYLRIRGTMYTLDKLDEVIKEVTIDYKPFIKYIGDGMYQINAGRYSCICSKGSAMEFDKVLKQKVEEYGQRSIL